MIDGDISYQCWICPFCYDDHFQHKPCKQEDLHEEITTLRKVIDDLTKDIE